MLQSQVTFQLKSFVSEIWGLLIAVKNWMNSKFTVYSLQANFYVLEGIVITPWLWKYLNNLFSESFFLLEVIKCIYYGVGHDEIIVWMWPLCISIRAHSTLIENLSSLREPKERYYAVWLSLWLISLEFDDWYAETFVQQLEVQFLLCFIDLKNHLTLLKQTVLITLPTSIPRVPDKL